MPIYEYRCSDCAHHFEVSQRMSDDPLSECELCQGAITKVLFAPAIHFKGTGFHNTDYGTRRRNAENENGSGGGEGGGDSGGGEAKGDGTGAEKKGDGGDPATKKEPASASKKTVGLDKV